MLIFVMGVCLAALGYFIGMELTSAFSFNPIGEEASPVSSDKGLIGLAIALGVWLVLMLVSLYASDNMILSMSGAYEAKRDLYPQLFNVVEEMKIAGSLPVMPKVYVMEDPSPNAFAVGKSPETSAVCVTAGLLAVCNRDELQGVIAHEMGHIMNRDVLFMTVAATMLGSITFISDFYLRTLRYSAIGRYTSSSRSGGKGGGWFIIIAVLLSILSPILATILYFSISRKREYLADATSARLTRYPEGLASALDKISASPAKLINVSKATAPFYIVNPLTVDNAGLFSTHPPILERI